ncbi:MAG: hypothetical protein M3N00_08190 [Actinomycetota bacterium]|nr:hypothetical protein [Actinomycetota bacterium]
MSDHTLEEPKLDVDTLRQAIQEEYAEVAANPEKGFHFHTGRPLAQMLQYADEWLEGIPEHSIESFASTGNLLGINFRARKAVSEEGLIAAMAALSCEVPIRDAGPRAEAGANRPVAS